MLTKGNPRSTLVPTNPLIKPNLQHHKEVKPNIQKQSKQSQTKPSAKPISKHCLISLVLLLAVFPLVLVSFSDIDHHCPTHPCLFVQSKFPPITGRNFIGRQPAVVLPQPQRPSSRLRIVMVHTDQLQLIFIIADIMTDIS